MLSNTEVVMMELNSTLQRDIIKGRLEDKKIAEIREQIKNEKAPRFMEMIRVLSGTRKGYVCLISRTSGN